MDKITELRQAIAKQTEALKTLTEDGEKFDRAYADITTLQGQLERELKAESASAAMAHPSGSNGGHEIIHLPAQARSITTPSYTHRVRSFDECLYEARANLGWNTIDTSTQYRSLPEQLMSVYQHAITQGADTDRRLIRSNAGSYQRTVLGQSEIDPSGGGFAVQSDFSQALLMRIYETGKLWGKTTKFSISENANGIKVPAVDETSRAEGQRYGGIQVYMVSEGAPATASSMKVRLVELDLKDLVGLIYASGQMVQDANQIVQLANTALVQEFGFRLDDYLIRGSGAGAPLGYLNSPAKVKVAKENGQGAKTILYENILNMESRMWGPSMSNAEWLVNSDTLPQLRQMNQVIGTAGFPVYLPPGGASGYPYGTLLGRPVNVIEQASTLGTEGDISLVDLSQILVAEKGGLQASSSIHVQYLTNQTAFKFTMRIDAQPWWHTALTPAQGTSTKSPFITLATRA